MTTTYNWSLTKLLCREQHDGKNNVVITVMYECLADDGTHQISHHGICEIPYRGGNFTEFNDLTESQIWSWLQNQRLDRNSIEQGLQRELDKQKIPAPVMRDLPWK